VGASLRARYFCNLASSTWFWVRVFRHREEEKMAAVLVVIMVSLALALDCSAWITYTYTWYAHRSTVQGYLAHKKHPPPLGPKA